MRRLVGLVLGGLIPLACLSGLDDRLLDGTRNEGGTGGADDSGAGESNGKGGSGVAGKGGRSGQGGSSGTTGTGGTLVESGGEAGSESGTGGGAGNGGSSGTGGGEAGMNAVGTGGAGSGGASGDAGTGGTSGDAGTGGTSSDAGTGGTSGTGATSGTGGAGAGGTSGLGGSSGSAGGGAAGSAGAGGSGGPPPLVGPCDLFGDAGTPCVAAYSTVRRLSSSYTGPLYQVRSNSSAQNTGSGGQTHDIGSNSSGFASAEAQDAACGANICTISLLYDQSGRGNHLPVAKAGSSSGGEFGDDDDFETIADEQEQLVDGHRVYPLYMRTRQGYRLPRAGAGMPLGTAPQGIYMLADGTHSGSACCWDFGNVSTDPKVYATMNTLFFGTAFWGRGAGSGPWFMADFEAGVWAGGTAPGDPGWGGLNGERPANPANPSLKVPYAIGFLKTDPQNWSLRMANLVAAEALVTAFAGGLPKPMNSKGAIVLGVSGDNSNNSFGTFFEGAIVSGFPSNEVELQVMQNVKAAGYGQ